MKPQIIIDGAIYTTAIRKRIKNLVSLFAATVDVPPNQVILHLFPCLEVDHWSARISIDHGENWTVSHGHRGLQTAAEIIIEQISEEIAAPSPT